MRVYIYLLATCLILHTCSSYIMITANMQDINALAEQLAASPVVDQVKKIWRRASAQFQRELRNTRRRGAETDEDDQEVMDTDRRTRRIVSDLVTLGKEAGYLEPIKQVLQTLKK